MTHILIPLIISIIFWIWIIRKYDKFEREPLRSIIYVLIVGGPSIVRIFANALRKR